MLAVPQEVHSQVGTKAGCGNVQKDKYFDVSTAVVLSGGGCSRRGGSPNVWGQVDGQAGEVGGVGARDVY